jgi:DNA-binding MarR family transcriptional regulator
MSTIEDVLTTLRRIIRATDLHSKHLEKIAGLTAPQLLLLELLRNGEVIASQLARQMSLSQATVTTIIDRLEKRGLVRRRRSNSDKRRVYTALTTAGTVALQNAPRPLQEHFVRRFQELHDWEQSMILSALQRVAQMMDAEQLDASPVLDVGALDRAAHATQPD